MRPKRQKTSHIRGDTAMIFTQGLRKMFRPWMQVPSASRRDESRQPSRPQRSSFFGPILELLEDRTLLSGTPGTVDPFLLTPVPDGTPIAMHIHPHLSILVNGQDQVIPA